MPATANGKLLSLLAAAFLVFCFAHAEGFLSPYVINDDVRQQVYWMQEWRDPGLYQDHYLTAYAKQYVPWGVQAIYWGTSRLIDPVQFSKILTAVLFTITAGLLFVLASRLFDDLTGVFTVCVYFHFAFFLGSISGGLSRGFVFPLLILYLIFLSREQTVLAGILIAVQALFNPYLFILCLFTHGLYLIHNRWFPLFFKERSGSLLVAGCTKQPGTLASLGHESLILLPVMAGILLLLARYRIFQTPDFGSVVSKSEMIGHLEYTAAGRYEIVPVPSIFFEFIRPFLQDLPIGVLGISAAVAGAGLILFIVVSGWNSRIVIREIKKLKVFIYLLFASVSLHFLAQLFLLELFLPSRYLEYSLTVFYCLSAGLLVRSAVESSKIKKHMMLLIILLIALGALRLKGVAIYDYGGQSSLYHFFRTTPRNAHIAGHPALMDNIMTFSQRKAFVSYELSHPWYGKYWSVIKPWTYDFFNAYFSDNPDDIRQFCRKYAIHYFVVRENDFVRNDIPGEAVYFEPFGSHIQKLKEKNASFAAIDEKSFKPVFQQNGIRVLTPAVE
jgi:hypothetical protein